MFARPWRAPFPAGDAFRTRRRSRVLPSTWKSAAAFSGKCERPGRSGIGGLADMELGMRLAAWRAWRRRAACGLVGDAGNAWCSKCWLCWRGLAVEMLRAWARGNVARAACDLVRGSALVAVWRVKRCACRLWPGKRIVDLPFKPCVASCWVVSARKCHKGASLQACRSDEMGNSALKIFATCGFAVAVSDCSSWGA